MTVLVVLWALTPGLSAPAGSGFAQAVQTADSTYGCLTCHADKRRAFRLGVHSERGIRCDDCHGGDPTTVETQSAHRGEFLGTPSKAQTVTLCSSCHSDPDQMRQFGLSADQLAEFGTSRHGMLLRAGNTDAPSCTDCHDAHTILRPEDARSNVHPHNIPSTCATCHEDGQMMAKYGLPTNQLELYSASAHGVAVFERDNFAAPTCVGCHGSHAALPPRVTEIASVCERCHQLLGREFDRGPHGPATQAGTLRGCLGCHGNHETVRTPVSEIAAVCTNCHEAGSAPDSVGMAIQRRVVQADSELESAAHALDELVRIGRSTDDARARYRAALTDFRQMAQVQHSLDLELLQDLGLRVASATGIVHAQAEVAAEEQWEHKLLLLPIWFFVLSGIVLATFKLREVR